MANTLNRERTLLSAFLFADTIDGNIDNAFKLDSNIFTSSFRRALADKINEETDNEKYYGLLMETIEDLVANTSHHQEWMDVLSANPMPLSVCKRMHTKLIAAYNERIAGSI